MAIVDKLKANIKASGGDTSGIHNIEDAVAKIGASSGGGVMIVHTVRDGSSAMFLDKTAG